MGFACRRYARLGVGALALGFGAALAGGPAMVHADAASGSDTVDAGPRSSQSVRSHAATAARTETEPAIRPARSATAEAAHTSLASPPASPVDAIDNPTVLSAASIAGRSQSSAPLAATTTSQTASRSASAKALGVNPIGTLLFNRTPTLNPVNTSQSSQGVARGQLNADDPDSASLSYTIVTGPAHGSVSFDTAGNYTYRADPSMVMTDYTDAFTVSVSDADSGFHIHGLSGLLNMLTFGLLGESGHTAVRTVPVSFTAGTAPPQAPNPPADTYSAGSGLPPRLQWDANFGYCGETSFISAGLNYGQYISQYDARAIASNIANQSLEGSQLLLGVNDVAAAEAMHLTAVAKEATTASFLTWVKSNVVAGYPVVMGVFMNQSRFYGTANLNAGFSEYDHIVTVTGVTSTRPLTGPATYYADDILTFNDNGLWTGTPNGQPQNEFNYAFDALAATRRQANTETAPVYSLKNGIDYGIAITGIIDLDRETVPVRLTTSTNAEIPAMVDGSSARPAATPLTLTITVSGLTPGKTYNLYRYASMAAVPDSNFNANSAKAAQTWEIVATGTTYTMTQTIMSDETAAYRAVPVTAR
jgi:VCBS repeat-containing protein